MLLESLEAQFHSVIVAATSFMVVTLIGFIVWFIKAIYLDHKEMFAHYTKNKEANIHKMMIDIVKLTGHVEAKNREHKVYFAQQRERANGNKQDIVDKIDKLINVMTDKIDKVEERFDNHIDKG